MATELHTDPTRAQHPSTGLEDEFLELVLDQMLEHAGMEAGTLHLLRGSANGGRAGFVPHDPIGQVARTGQALHFHVNHENADWRRWLERHQWHSALLVPLTAREQLVGVLALGSLHERRQLSEAEIRRVQELATHVAMAIAYDSVVHASSSDLPSLIESLGKLSPSHVLETLLDFLLGIALGHSRAEVAAFLLTDTAQHGCSAALVKSVRGDKPAAIKHELRTRLEHLLEASLPPGQGANLDGLLVGLPVSERVPLEFEQQRYGELVLFQTNHREPSAEPSRLRTIAAEAATLIQKTLRLREIEQVIFTDPLTGLYTRTYWHQRAEQELDRSRRRLQPVSVVMLDLDFFKKVNDSFGHPAGDRVLCEVAGSLRESLRKHDVVARYGGEEFIVLLPHTNHQNGMLVATRLLQHLRDLRIGIDTGVTIHVTASLGLASTHDSTRLVSELVQRADGALYEAKRQGRNQLRYAGAEEAAQTVASAAESSRLDSVPLLDLAEAPSDDDSVLRAFVNRLCCEVNNPAAIILGTTELLLDGHSDQLDEATKEVLRLVIDQAARIGQVTRSISAMPEYRTVEWGGVPMIDLGATVPATDSEA